MFSFLSSAGTKIIEMFQDMGYFDSCEISKINENYIPGLEIQLAYERLQKYDYHCRISPSVNKEIGILYKLKFGEIGARVSCKSDPIAQFDGKLRRFMRFAGYELNAMGVFDINGHKLDKWNAGINLIAGNVSAHLKLHADEYVFSTRHRIHPRFVSLTEICLPYKKWPRRSSHLAMGFEFELSSRASLEVMVPEFRPATFALQYQFSKPQCLVRVYGDAYSNRTGVSFAFHPYSVC